MAASVFFSRSSAALPISPPVTAPTAPPIKAPAPVWPVALPMSAPVPAPMAPPPNTPRSVLDMDEQPQASSTRRTATPRRRRGFIDQLLSVPLIGRGQSAGRLRKAVLF